MPLRTQIVAALPVKGNSDIVAVVIIQLEVYALDHYVTSISIHTYELCQS